MKLAILRWPYIHNNEEKQADTVDELTWCMKDLREVLLKECDWTVGNDSPLDQLIKDDWLIWRQWMRDITQHVTITDIVEYVDILTPPVTGRPKSWVNFEHIDP